MKALAYLKNIFSKLQLVDKCLLFFLVILFYQSVHNLFMHELTLEDAQNIDVVIRTLSASIFGYFISNNFQNYTLNKISPDNPEPKDSIPTPPTTTPNTNKITFRRAEISEAPKNGHANIIECRRKQQILIVTTIGILSLIVLAVARNVGNTSEAALATLSQFRDFASGSIGFLLAYSRQQK